jgi:hypothetical protein
MINVLTGFVIGTGLCSLSGSCRHNQELKNKPENKETYYAWFDKAIIRKKSPEPCTEGLFNFIGHFVRSNKISDDLEHDSEEIICMMLSKGVIPVFKSNPLHSAGLQVDYFRVCERSPDILLALRDIVEKKLEFSDNSNWIVEKTSKYSRRQNPQQKDWEKIRKDIVEIRERAKEEGVRIESKTLRSYLGATGPGDKVVAVLTVSEAAPLSTMLRLQGRMVDFIGNVVPSDHCSELDFPYVVDSVTDEEFKYLAQTGFHLTAFELKKQIYDILPTPFLGPEYDKIREEYQKAQRSACSKFEKKRILNKNTTFFMGPGHEGVMLDILADLNPDIKFVLLKNPLHPVFGTARDVYDIPPDVLPKTKQPTLGYATEIIEEMVFWLKERNVKSLVSSQGRILSNLYTYASVLQVIFQAELSEFNQVFKELKIEEGGSSLGSSLREIIFSLQVESILEKTLLSQGIDVFRAVPNPVQYFGELSESKIQGLSEQTSRLFANIELLRTVFNFRENNSNKGQFFRVVSFDQSNINPNVIEEAKDSKRKLSHPLVSRLPWYDLLNYVFSEIAIDMRESSKNLECSVARSRSEFLSLHLWNYLDHEEPRRVSEKFGGVALYAPSFGRVEECNSFANPIAMSWILSSKIKLSNSDVPWYVRPCF